MRATATATGTVNATRTERTRMGRGYVAAVQDFRRSSATARHTDRRREASRSACRGNGLRKALREHGYR
jgi:hypothetical protein